MRFGLVSVAIDSFAWPVRNPLRLGGKVVGAALRPTVSLPMIVSTGNLKEAPMLRLRFEVNDLARTTFAAPFLLCEVAGSVEAVQRPASGFRQRCRSWNTHLPQQARPLLGVVSAYAGVPEFLAPERAGQLDGSLTWCRGPPHVASPGS